MTKGRFPGCRFAGHLDVLLHNPGLLHLILTQLQQHLLLPLHGLEGRCGRSAGVCAVCVEMQVHLKVEVEHLVQHGIVRPVPDLGGCYGVHPGVGLLDALHCCQHLQDRSQGFGRYRKAGNDR